MKRSILLGILALTATSLMAADGGPSDEVKAAIKKLKDSGSFTWKTTTENASGNGPGPTVGKVNEDGVIYMARTFNDNTFESIKKGEKVAIKTQDGWQTPEEMADAAGNGGNGGRRGRGAMAGRMMRNYAEVAAELVDGVKEIKDSGGIYVGDLTEDAAKRQLTAFGGRGRGGNGTPPEVSGAKGSVKIWVKEGVLSKVVLHVQGTVSRGGQDQDVDRTTTVEFKDIGSTKIEIPEEAKKKLS